MNLARFGLIKNSAGAIEPEGGIELVEVSEWEALNSAGAKFSKYHSVQELLQQASQLSANLPASFGAQVYAESTSVDASVDAFSDLTTMRASGSRPKRKRKKTGSLPIEMDISPIPPKRKRKYVKHEKKTVAKYVEKVKAKLGIVDLKKPMLTVDKDKLLNFHLSPDEVLELFHKETKKRQKLDKNLFARNMVWELYKLSQSERPPDFIKDGCNMRTIFYLFKPTLTNNGIFTDDTEKTKSQKKADEGDIDSFYGNFTRAVQELVLEGLISYSDLNIQDDRKPFRFLPPARFNTHILFLAEKKAYLGQFLTLASRYGVMAQITNGRSSYVMTDTMLTEMFELGYDFSKNLSILSFCDFDPVGTSIPFHFVGHLKKLGFHNVNHFEQYGKRVINFRVGKKKSGRPLYEKLYQKRPCLDIVNPLDFDAKTRNRMRHALKGSQRNDASTKKWALITGGVTGTGKNTKYAISAEQFLPYVEKEIEKKLPPLLSVPPEKVGLSSRLRLLTRELQRHIGIRALQKAQESRK